MRRFVVEAKNGLGNTLEGCIPIGSIVSWEGNWDLPAYARGGYEAPPIAHVVDNELIRQDLKAAGFDLLNVEWIAGYANPYVRVRARTTSYWDSKDQAAGSFNAWLGRYTVPRMAKFSIDIKSGFCPGDLFLCPPGTIDDGGGGCVGVVRRPGNSFLPDATDEDWVFDASWNFDDQATQPIADYHYAATDTPTSEDSKGWVLLAVGAGLLFLVFKN